MKKEEQPVNESRTEDVTPKKGDSSNTNANVGERSGLSELGKSLLKAVKGVVAEQQSAKAAKAAADAQGSHSKTAGKTSPVDGHGDGKTTIIKTGDAAIATKPVMTIEEESPILPRHVLDEIHQRTLEVINPKYDESVVEYDFKTFEFRPTKINKSEIVIFELHGNIINVGSIEKEDDDEEFLEDEQELVKSKEDEDIDGDEESVADVLDDSDRLSEAGDKNEDEGEDGEQGAEEIAVEDDSKKASVKKKLTNQFNFSDRGALTYSVVTRDGCTQTAPPPTATTSGQVTQWRIYDFYQEDYENTQSQKGKERMTKTVASKKEEDTRKLADDTYYYRLSQATKIMERMVNQNAFEEIAFDCQFYDDPADKYRPGEGAVLPLWDFRHEESKGLTVTDLAWNPKYYDMFAVSFGSFSCNKIKRGAVCVYSLKNPAYPEKVIRCRSGAMCIDFHTNKPYYLAIGLYDGSVCVFNVKEGDSNNLLQSNVWKKHSGCVWQVHWCDDPRDTQLCFYSVGSDGKICKWLALPNELAQTPVITLFLDTEKLPGPDGVAFSLSATPNCIAFHPENYEIFLVGTAEGYIYKCSVSYASSYLYVYLAHDMPINRINHNNYLHEIFASCSDDWRVKIWEDNLSEPLFEFDLECVVGDVQWAPYSSTIFSAITSDGNIHIYDLNLNKHEAICVQSVFAFEQSIATRIRFNNKVPIILAGDSKGQAISLKVSPNCRLPTKMPKKLGTIEPRKLEIMKLEKVLAFVREPNVSQMGELETKADSNKDY